MNERWRVTTPHWSKTIFTKDKEERDERVADFINADNWDDRVDEDGDCWIWVECESLVDGERCACEININGRPWETRR